MPVKIGIQIEDQVLPFMEALFPTVARGTQEALEVQGKKIVDSLVRYLSKPGTGRIYKINGRIHVASAPGKPPTPFTKRLRSSNQYKVVRRGAGFVLEIWNDTPYGATLEYGTRHMAPRPWFRVTVSRYRTAGHRAAITGLDVGLRMRRKSRYWRTGL
jgi:hypothetical protein